MFWSYYSSVFGSPALLIGHPSSLNAANMLLALFISVASPLSSAFHTRSTISSELRLYPTSRLSELSKAATACLANAFTSPPWAHGALLQELPQHGQLRKSATHAELAKRLCNLLWS